MQAIATYQQDTLQVKKLIQSLPDQKQSVELKVRTNPVALDAIPERKVSAEPKEKTQVKPSASQIRYLRKLREQKLVVGESRYIEPRNDVRLVASTNPADSGITLPIHTINNVNSDWITIILILALTLFATLRNSYVNYLKHLFQSVVNYSTAFRMFRERNYPILHAAFRLEVYFYITSSVFIYQLLGFFHLESKFSGFMLYLICLLSVTGYFFVKKLLYYILGLTFEGTSETGEYLFNLNNFNRILGLFLFPVIAFIAYNPFRSALFPVVMGIVTIFIFYFLLLQRGILILLKKQFSIFYLFLYLCTLEFLPLLLIFKEVVGIKG